MKSNKEISLVPSPLELGMASLSDESLCTFGPEISVSLVINLLRGLETGIPKGPDHEPLFQHA